MRRGKSSTSVLFDTGLSPGAMTPNADRLGLDLQRLQALVLSHRHLDHAGGLAGSSQEWPTLSKRALLGEGFDVIERRSM